eukprot:SAG31_NODE_2215_length_6172_cov_3.268730_3_plen_340_part_00
MEAKIERTEAAAIELHNENVTNIAADIKQLDEKVSRVTREQVEELEAVMREQIDQLNAHVGAYSAETEDAKQLAQQLRQAHAAHEAAISERVEHNSGLLRSHGAHFAKIETLDAQIRKFGDRLTQLDEDENRRIRAIERELRDAGERVDQLQQQAAVSAANTSSAELSNSPGSRLSLPGVSDTASSNGHSCQSDRSKEDLESDMTTVRRGLEALRADLGAQETVSLEATRRLQQQLTKVEISSEDTAHTLKTMQKDSGFEVESLQAQLTNMQQRLTDVVQDLGHSTQAGGAAAAATAGERAKWQQQINSIIERVACVEQVWDHSCAQNSCAQNRCHQGS